MIYKDTSRSIFGALFLIGLGIIALFKYWWPGIMFVLGGSLVLNEWFELQSLNFRRGNVIAGFILIGFGLLNFLEIPINFSVIWPIIFITMGCMMLMSSFATRNRS